MTKSRELSATGSPRCAGQDSPAATEYDLFGRCDIPRRFTWRGRWYEIRDIGGHWRRRGRWWEGEGERRFFRAITTRGVTLDLCLDESTGTWSVAAVHD